MALRGIGDNRGRIQERCDSLDTATVLGDIRLAASQPMLYSMIRRFTANIRPTCGPAGLRAGITGSLTI